MFFRDPDEQPIDLIHQIKLYPASPEGVDQKSLGAPPQQNSKKPVVSEQYDEAVFTDPTESFKRLLMLYSTFPVDARASDAAGMVGSCISCACLLHLTNKSYLLHLKSMILILLVI